jgi:hypothetical protein
MFRPYHAGIVLCLLASACVRPAPTELDSTPPNITLSLLSGTGTPHFSSDEEDTNPTDACGMTRSFPATVSVAVGDAGGIHVVSVRILFAELVESSVTVGPATPGASYEIRRVGASDVLIITVRPPGTDLVRTGVVTTFDVEAPGAILVEAFDVTGNAAYLYQVDVRGPTDGVVCRNESV